MESFINLDKVKEALEGGVEQAAGLLKDNEKINSLIDNVQAKIKEVPQLDSLIGDVPVMVDMVKSYVKKEYTVVSPKVVALLVSAFLYLVKRKDIVSDAIPVLGLLDDIAMIGLTVKLSGPELQAFREWKAAQNTAAEEKPEETL